MAGERSFGLVGHDFARKDSVARVTGREIYSVDVSLPRMLDGRVVASPYAHAIVKSIDTSAAVAMGAMVVTFADVPQAKFDQRIITIPPVLHKVRRMGEAGRPSQAGSIACRLRWSGADGFWWFG